MKKELLQVQKALEKEKIEENSSPSQDFPLPHNWYSKIGKHSSVHFRTEAPVFLKKKKVLQRPQRQYGCRDRPTCEVEGTPRCWLWEHNNSNRERKHLQRGSAPHSGISVHGRWLTKNIQREQTCSENCLCCLNTSIQKQNKWICHNLMLPASYLLGPWMQNNNALSTLSVCKCK